MPARPRPTSWVPRPASTRAPATRASTTVRSQARPTRRRRSTATSDAIVDRRRAERGRSHAVHGRGLGAAVPRRRDATLRLRPRNAPPARARGRASGCRRAGLTFERWTNGVKTAVTVGAGLPLHAWSLVTATYDGATMRLFVNGKQLASRATTVSLPAVAGPTELGAAAGGTSGFFAGDLDEVAALPAGARASARRRPLRGRHDNARARRSPARPRRRTRRWPPTSATRSRRR